MDNIHDIKLTSNKINKHSNKKSYFNTKKKIRKEKNQNEKDLNKNEVRFDKEIKNAKHQIENIMLENTKKQTQKESITIQETKSQNQKQEKARISNTRNMETKTKKMKKSIEYNMKRVLLSIANSKSNIVKHEVRLYDQLMSNSTLWLMMIRTSSHNEDSLLISHFKTSMTLVRKSGCFKFIKNYLKGKECDPKGRDIISNRLLKIKD